MMDIEENKVFLKFDASEISECKKEVLEIVESLIQAEIASRKFSELRIRERKMVSRLKNDLKIIYNDLKKLPEELPRRIHHREKKEFPEEFIEDNKSHKESNKKIKNVKKISDSERYMKELEDIREKIARFG